MKRLNIDDLEDMLATLKCKFANAVYLNYIAEEYALDTCSKLDLEKIKDYIDILSDKIKVLKWRYKKYKETSIKYPNRIDKTDLESFINRDLIVADCDINFIEKVKVFL